MSLNTNPEETLIMYVLATTDLEVDDIVKALVARVQDYGMWDEMSRSPRARVESAVLGVCTRMWTWAWEVRTSIRTSIRSLLTKVLDEALGRV